MRGSSVTQVMSKKVVYIWKLLINWQSTGCSCHTWLPCLFCRHYLLLKDIFQFIGTEWIHHIHRLRYFLLSMSKRAWAIWTYTLGNKEVLFFLKKIWRYTSANLAVWIFLIIQNLSVTLEYTSLLTHVSSHIKLWFWGRHHC